MSGKKSRDEAADELSLERFFPIFKEATAQNNEAVSETVFAILKRHYPVPGKTTDLGQGRP